jgi:hypothetical protein
LVRADVDVVARLKIADIGFSARSIEVLRGTRDRDGGDRLVVVFDDDSLVTDVAQYPDERHPVGLTPLLLRSARTVLRIPLATAAGISATGIPTAGISTATVSDDDLTKPRNARQKGKYQ